MSSALSVQHKDSRTNLASWAYAVIKQKILAREIRGGSTIVEGRLAAELDLSRTPLREALRRLAGEGLLVKEGTRQFTVRQVTATEFFQSMRVRELLESEMAGLAAGRLDAREADALKHEIRRLGSAQAQTQDHWHLDDQVHEAIARAGGNIVAAQIIQDLRVATRMFEINRPFGRVHADAAEHLQILEAVESGNRSAASEAMRAHLQQIQNEVLAVITGQ
jgi:DNA-binding GntR family transcriptional regulator